MRARSERLSSARRGGVRDVGGRHLSTRASPRPPRPPASAWRRGSAGAVTTNPPGTWKPGRDHLAEVGALAADEVDVGQRQLVEPADPCVHRCPFRTGPHPRRCDPGVTLRNHPGDPVGLGRRSTRLAYSEARNGLSPGATPVPRGRSPWPAPRSCTPSPAERPSDFVTIVRGEGAAVFDDSRAAATSMRWRRSGTATSATAAAEIADAVDRQLRTLEAFHTFEMFTNEPAEAFCGRGRRHGPDARRPRVFLTNSGSEAVDTALKLARLSWSWQGQPERSLDRVARAGLPRGRPTAAPRPRACRPTRSTGARCWPTSMQAHADDLAEVEALLRRPRRPHRRRHRRARAGRRRRVPARSPATSRGCARLCDEHGALLIFDEVITGFGRLGTWWGAQRYGVTPDLITFAKGATSGYQPARRGGGGPHGARRARGRRHPLAAPRLHLLRPPGGLRGGRGQPRDPRATSDLLARAPHIGDRLAAAASRRWSTRAWPPRCAATDGIWALGHARRHLGHGRARRDARPRRHPPADRHRTPWRSARRSSSTTTTSTHPLRHPRRPRGRAKATA